jgi:hypothetical protein
VQQVNVHHTVEHTFVFPFWPLFGLMVAWGAINILIDSIDWLKWYKGKGR